MWKALLAQIYLPVLLPTLKMLGNSLSGICWGRGVGWELEWKALRKGERESKADQEIREAARESG